MSITTICDECGIPISMPLSQFRRSKNHFCSKQCHMTFMNRMLNPTRMTEKTKEKIRKARLGTGEGKAYTKTHGKHTHRVIAEQILGRPLKDGEVVHHIDGNKLNNDPSNIMIFPNQSEHAKWHWQHRKEVMKNHVDKAIRASN